jgi:hypothetical protein
MAPRRQSAERLPRRAWRAIDAFGILVALVYPVACGGSTAPSGGAGDASSPGGSAGSAGSPGSAGNAGQSGRGGDAGQSGSAGQGGQAGGAAGGAGSSGVGGLGGAGGLDGGDAGQSGSAGQGGQAGGAAGGAGSSGVGGLAGAGGLDGGDAGGRGGASGTGGSADSGATCPPSRDGGTRADPDARPPGTFPCPGPPFTQATLFCLTGEYCVYAGFNGVEKVPPTCLPLPSGCSSCECIVADARSCVLAPWTACQQYVQCSVPPNAPGPFVSCILP